MTANNTLPGDIRQISYVVRDLDATIERWLELGIGPWYVIRSFRQRGGQYRGQAGEPLISIALANSGELQIELVQQEDDTPSCYTEFLDAGHEGFHHVSFWADDFDAASAAADGSWELVQSGDARSGYYDTGGVTSTIVEISEMTDRFRWLSDTIREAAREWDGHTDPIRSVPPRPGWAGTASPQGGPGAGASNP